MINHVSHLKRHEETSYHKGNVGKKRNQIQIESLLNKNESSLKRQIYLAEITMVMFCITHNLPFSIMDFLPDLLFQCCPDSKIASALQCARTKSTFITEKLGNKAIEKIISEIKENRFSLIIDETTDITSKKALVLVVRYIDKNTKVIKDRFLSFLEMIKTDANTIFETIKNFFDKHEIPLQNLIGLATDGATVMAGEFGGVQAKFKQNNINLLFIKCTCHSLHLCTSYACKKLPVTVEKLCRNIFNFFAHSSKRIAEFKEFQDYCSVKSHKILGISSTRWLSLDNVINRIIEQWDALRLYFISCSLEINGIQSTELAESMSSPRFKIYFLFLSYILHVINNLNKEFQSEKSRLPYLYSQMEITYKLIASNFMDNNYVQNINADEINIYNKNKYLPTKDIYIGTKTEIYLKEKDFSEEEIINIKTNVLNFYLELAEQIKSRFDFKNYDLKNLCIIQPQQVLSQPIMPLLLSFSHLIKCDIELLSLQWKQIQLSKIEFNPEDDLNDYWIKISKIKNAAGEYCFKDLTNFIFDLLILPHSSATAERKFSEFALIKTKLRNKLELKTINNIMLAKELLKSKELHYVWSAKELF